MLRSVSAVSPRRSWGSGKLRYRDRAGEIGVLVNFAVDRQRHAFVDLVPEARETAIELEDQTADSVRLDFELGQRAGKPRN
jgi:hypothetical protein